MKSSICLFVIALLFPFSGIKAGAATQSFASSNTLDQSAISAPKDLSASAETSENISLSIADYNSFTKDVKYIQKTRNLPQSSGAHSVIKEEYEDSVYYFSYDYRGQLQSIRKLMFEATDTSKTKENSKKSFIYSKLFNRALFSNSDGSNQIIIADGKLSSANLKSRDGGRNVITWSADGDIISNEVKRVEMATTPISFAQSEVQLSTGFLTNKIDAVQPFKKDAAESINCNLIMNRFEDARQRTLRILFDDSQSSAGYTRFIQTSNQFKTKARVDIDQPDDMMVSYIQFNDRLEGLVNEEASFIFFFRHKELYSYESQNGLYIVQFYPGLKPRRYIHKLALNQNFEVEWDTSGTLIREGIAKYGTVDSSTNDNKSSISK